MANNYLTFSECIPDISEEEAAFVRECLLWEPPYNDDHELPEDFEWPAWYDQDAEGVGFDAHIDKKDKAVYFSAEEYGNVDTLAAMVHELITKFRPDFVFSLTYSETCSKLRLGEFGGGAIVVSKYGTDFINAHGWASEREAQIRKRLQGEK